MNIVTQWCVENLYTLLHPIYLNLKSQQLVSKLESSQLDSTYRGSPKSAGLYLEIILLDCLITKKIPGFSRTFQDWWEPYHLQMEFFKNSVKFIWEIILKIISLWLLWHFHTLMYQGKKMLQKNLMAPLISIVRIWLVRVQLKLLFRTFTWTESENNSVCK